MSEPDELNVTGVTNAANCSMPNGSIDISVTGGTLAYSFLWSTGATTEDVAGINSGLYSVIVTDNNACTAVWSATLTQNNLPLNLNGDIQSSICYYDNTGSITLSITNGLGPYVYNWSNGMTDGNPQGLAEGTYFVTVTDANGCTASESYLIEITEDVLTLDLNSPLYSNGFNISTHAASDGVINATVNGGVQAYIYDWSNGASTQNLVDVTAGQYTLTVTDANGCTVSESIELTEPEPELPEMPEGISPNNDRLNDAFVVRNIEFYPNNILRIYNRWGEEIISFEHYMNQWDGLNKEGNILPEGTYFAILSVEVRGEEMILKGHVDIRR